MGITAPQLWVTREGTEILQIETYLALCGRRSGKIGVGKTAQFQEWIYLVDEEFPSQSYPLKNSYVLPEWAFFSTSAVIWH